MTSRPISRRDLFTLGGAALAGVTLGESGRRALGRRRERDRVWKDRGHEHWATSVCMECAAGCGVRVRLIDDVPVKLEGNPLCPIGRGRLCAQGQAALESHFDPDRLVGPAKRAGARGEGRWEPITWAVAIEMLAAALRPATGSDRPAAIAMASEAYGPITDAWTRFWTAVGGRAVFSPAASSARFRAALGALTGAEANPVFDLNHASHVLSLGAPIVESWLSPVWAQRSFGGFRGASRPRGRLVQVDGRRSPSARKADEWLAVAPADQEALALAIASVLLRENRVDHAFLDRWTGNFAALERALLDHYAPDQVAVAIGVPVVTILRLARELAASDRPLVVTAADAAPGLVDAVFILDALLGAYDRAGGIFASPAPPRPATVDATEVLRQIAAGKLQPSVLAFHDASALRALAAPPDLTAALANTPLVVSLSPFLDEASTVADLLLPGPTALERWHAVAPPPAVAMEVAAVAAPAVRPWLDTRDVPAVLREVAGRLGGAVAQACAWQSSEDLVAAEVDRLWGERRGTPFSTPYETDWVLELERGGWWTPAATSREEFAERLLASGGWVDPFFEPGALMRALEAQRGLRFPIPRPLSTSSRARQDHAATNAAYPLSLTPFTPAVVNLSGSPNQPVLYELLGQPDGAPWRVWAELSPETAAAHGIGHGVPVRITSASGAVEAIALHVDGARADAVYLAYVPAVPHGGRWVRELPDDARRLWPGGRVQGTCEVRMVPV